MGWQYGTLQVRLDGLLFSFAARIAANHDVRLLNPNRLSAESPPNQRLDVKALNQSGFPFQLGHTDALAALMARLLARRHLSRA